MGRTYQDALIHSAKTVSAPVYDPQLTQVVELTHGTGIVAATRYHTLHTPPQPRHNACNYCDSHRMRYSKIDRSTRSLRHWPLAPAIPGPPEGSADITRLADVRFDGSRSTRCLLRCNFSVSSCRFGSHSAPRHHTVMPTKPARRLSKRLY